eukprot:c27676_g1_i1 orf=440-1837(+)
MAQQSTDGSQSGNAPPPFLNKTYDMVDDPSTDAIVSWSSNDTSFVVWNPPEFARDLLPKYFKHNNFSSFIRQLNTYGFRKVDPDRWEFATEGFMRGQRCLLKNIHRRKPSSHSHSQQLQRAESPMVGCVEVGKLGLEEEVERLRQDKNILMMELIRLRQQQQVTEHELQELWQRLQTMEQRQQQMMMFLAKAMQNPEILTQLVQQNENKIRLAAANKKRRLTEQEAEGEIDDNITSQGQIVKYHPGDNDASHSTLMQILDSNIAANLDVSASSLESLMRELGHIPLEQSDGATPATRISGVTLTEMNASAPFSELLVNEIQDQTIHELSSSTIAFPQLEQEAAEQASVHSDIEVPDYLGSILANPEGKEVKVDRMTLDLNLSTGARFSPENESGETDGGDGGPTVQNINDGFWEQFLTESPSSTDTEAEMGTEVSQNCVKQCWKSNLHVDQLTEQMGQLVSASKH